MWGRLRRDKRCRNGKSQNRAMLRMGRRLTGHPRLGAAGIPEAAGAFTCVNLFCSSDLDFPRVTTVDVRKRQNRSGRTSRKRVDPSRVAREGEIRAADATGAASFARPGFVRRLFGRRLRPEALLSRQTRSRCWRWNTTRTMGGRGDCERPIASPQAVRETVTKTNRKRVSGRLRGESNRAIPQRGESAGADHGPSSPVPQRAQNALRPRCVPGR
jgi:hypothetical protein